MKKSVGIYSIIWAICLAVFNAIVFLTPNTVGGASKFTVSFWVAYACITATLVGLLFCALMAFRAKTPKKLFYHLPLISIGYLGLFAMLIAGSIFMAMPSLPEWIGIVVCAIILILHAIALIKATTAAQIASDMDEKLKRQTSFLKKLAADAKSLMVSATSDELRAEAKRIYEAIRYGSPMSNASLSELDSQIERQFTAFADAVKAEDAELAKDVADALLELLEKRNQKV